MLHFFRLIRRRLLTENKFSRYLLYAVGEIILVVIGILIALQVNNWNQKRIGAEKNKVLFKEVSYELVQNIENIDRIIDLYIEKDSLYFLVFNKLVTQEDYRTSDRLFHFAFNSDTDILKPLGYERTGLVSEDYKELVAGKNRLTDLQDSIFSELKDLYGKRKSNVDLDDETIYNTQLDFRDKMMERQSWWSHYVKFGIITDEMIQYALNNPSYMNQLSELSFREQSHMRGLLAFRIKALNLYEKIMDMLQLEKDTVLVQDIADFEHIKGTYKAVFEGGGSASFYIKGEKELRSRQFFNDSPVGPGAFVYLYGKSHLIIHRKDKKDANWLAKIEYGKDGEVLGLSWYAQLRVEKGKKRKYIQPKIE